MDGRRHVLGIDVGTTTVRGLVYGERGEVEGEAKSTIQPIIPRPGYYEIDPDALWDQVQRMNIRVAVMMMRVLQICQVVRDCISDAGLEAGDITSMGISCQVLRLVLVLFSHCDLLSEGDLHVLVGGDGSPLSQPGDLEGPEGGQPCQGVEHQPDHAGPEGGGAAAAHPHQDAEVSRHLI